MTPLNKYSLQTLEKSIEDSPFNKLSNEIFLHILSFIQPADIASTRLTCRLFRVKAAKEAFRLPWQTSFLEKFLKDCSPKQFYFKRGLEEGLEGFTKLFKINSLLFFR